MMRCICTIILLKVRNFLEAWILCVIVGLILVAVIAIVVLLSILQLHLVLVDSDFFLWLLLL